MKTKILIAIEQVLFRDALEALLSQNTAYSVSSASITGLKETIARDAYHILLIDSGTFSAFWDSLFDGPSATAILSRTIVIAMNSLSKSSLHLYKKGIAGYLAGQNTALELEDAIKAVAAGRRYIPTEQAEIFFSLIENRKRRVTGQELSSREEQVFRMLVSGMAVCEIADALNLSCKTIATFRTRLLKKLQLRTNVDLVKYSLQNHLFE